MKIGFNIKKIQSMIPAYVQAFYQAIIYPSMQTLNNRVTTLEASEWVKLTSSSGNIEINQEFSEIRMIASVYDSSNIEFSFSCNYDSNIFHNSTNGRDVYFIAGNPIVNNYGCKFKYTVASDGKQYISVDS